MTRLRSSFGAPAVGSTYPADAEGKSIDLRNLCDQTSHNNTHCPPRTADDASLSFVSLYHGCSLSHLLFALSTMVEPLYPLFPIASFLGFVLVLIPLPWHLQAWNSGTCFYVFWTSLACLNQFINSVVWANDALNRAPVWCDICKCDPLSVPVIGPD